MHFKTRKEFREWLENNYDSHEGIWILFGKSKEIETLKPNEALEEALCFGWIDGVMKKIDDKSYIKYFALRRKNSKWSEKNKKIYSDLEKQGIMTDYGRVKVEEAKKNGQWENADKFYHINEVQIEEVTIILKNYELAYTNFQGMSPSVKKTYTRAYFDAKTPEGRQKRLAWMIDRLEKNLKPM